MTKSKCFVLMDFNEQYKVVYDKAIKPAAEQANLICIRADEIRKTGDILGQVLSEIQNATLIIADLTGNNTNVAYEIGYAHHLMKKTILIAQSLENIPFDFRNQRIIKYSTSDKGLTLLLEELFKTLEYEISSPAELLRKIILPAGKIYDKDKFIIATSPLTFQDKKSRPPNVRRPLQEVDSYAEYVGIIGLVQAFGIIFGLSITPCLINPKDFDDQSATDPANLYLLGSPKSNKWTKIILDKIAKIWYPSWQFVVDRESADLRDPRLNLEKDGNPYVPSRIAGQERTKIDFGLILRAPHPDYKDKMVLILAGRTGLGTAASCVAVTTPDYIYRLIDKLPGIENKSHPFWAITSVKRKKGTFNVDRESATIEDAGYLNTWNK